MKIYGTNIGFKIETFYSFLIIESEILNILRIKNRKNENLT